MSLAISCGEDALTYVELNARANRYADVLISEGVGGTDRVGICLPYGIDAFACLLGVMKVGAAFVLFDQAQASVQLVPSIEQAALSYLISDQLLLNQSSRDASERLVAANLAEALQQIRVINLDDKAVVSALASANMLNPDVVVTADAAAFATPVGGTGREWSGRFVCHRGVVNSVLALADALKLAPSDRVAQCAELCTDDVIQEVLSAWLCGACVVLREEQGTVKTSGLQRWLAQHRISVCALSQARWMEWVDELQHHSEVPPDCLRLVWVQGHRLPMKAYQCWRAYKLTLVTTIGLTTPGHITLCYRAQGDQPFEQYLPSGEPIANTQVFVVDAYGRPVPMGVTGELWIGGDSITHGYIEDESKADALALENPVGSGQLVNTGGLARWLPSGILEYLGPSDGVLMIRGHRIALADIRQQLQQLALISQAHVVAHQPRAGEAVLAVY
jgi:non-ribosomal peptide synthetase component F